MIKVFAFSILSLVLSATVFGVHFSQKSAEPIDNSQKIAEPGLVAYAASYASDITNEPNYSTQNNKTFQYLNLGSALNTYRGDSVKVGIIDSGINYDHEDFIVNGQTKVKGDSKYYTYQTSQWVYYKASQHGYSYIDDTLGHGTNVAATVAAAVNSIGGLGLAPNVELYVYKVTNAQHGYEFGAIQNALMDAKTIGIDVINMSFQSYEHAVSFGNSSMGASSGCSSILSYYLNQAYNAGITLVGAAGNYNTDEPSYPGSNDHVINVGSLDQTGTGKASFSNYGNTIDLVAPGYVYVADEASNSAYTTTQGTSFSAPLVTAAIALYKQKNPSATPAQIESALYASCDEIDDSGSQYTNWAGHGSLNVAKFLDVQEDTPSEDSPTVIIINNPEIIDEELALEVGDTFDLDWTVNGIGTFDNSVSFSTLDDNGTLSVDSNGRITALSEGSDYVIIESDVDSNIYASVYVTVTAKAHRTVIEENTPDDVITWPSSSTASITKNNFTNVSASLSGKTVYESSSIRLGTGNGGGTLTISAKEKIYAVTVIAKYYSSSYSSSVLKVNGASVGSLTGSYKDYNVNIAGGLTSFTILTQNSSSRVNIQSVTIYGQTIEEDIGESDDCVGLETFINTYMHMDYTENLGYCKDNEHHYYSSAKSAFNALNEHQRSLFTSNSAYLNEWTRLSTWATFNGDTLNGSNLLASNKTKVEELARNNFNLGEITIISILSSCSLLSIVLFIYLKRKKEN